MTRARSSAANPATTPREVTPRALKPAPPVSVMPAAISDQNCYVACGLKPEQFRLIVPKAGIPFLRVGNRVIVATTDLLSYIRGGSVAPVSPDAVAPAAGDEDQVTDVDAVLSLLNRRRTA